MTIVFKVIDKTVGLRVLESEEIIGLEIEEHVILNSYADFMPMISTLNVIPIENNDVDKATNLYDYKSEDKITKIVVLINQSKFESLKRSLNYVGVTGMTVTQVLGCGVQKGTLNIIEMLRWI